MFFATNFDPPPLEITCVLGLPEYGQVTSLSIRNRLENAFLVTYGTDDVINSTSAEIFRFLRISSNYPPSISKSQDFVSLILM